MSKPRADATTQGLAIQSLAGAVSFAVVVVPRASRSRVVGLHGDGSLKVTLAAAPVDGAANQALCELLADTLDVPKRAVRIQRGERSKRKTVEVAGIARDEVLLRLGLLSP